MRRPTKDFMSRVVKDRNGCWLWQRYIMKNGYGQYRKDGNFYAHRYSYATHVGRIPNGLWVLHKCDVRNCVRPGHLFLGTCRDNHLDMYAKGREVNTPQIGEENPNAKLTTDIAAAIRNEYGIVGVRQIDLASKYRISRTQIGRIVRGEHWVQ